VPKLIFCLIALGLATDLMAAFLIDRFDLTLGSALVRWLEGLRVIAAIMLALVITWVVRSRITKSNTPSLRLKVISLTVALALSVLLIPSSPYRSSLQINGRPFMSYIMPRVKWHEPVATLKTPQQLRDEEIARAARISDRAKSWWMQASRTDSALARDEAIQTILKAIRSTDAEMVESGLSALPWVQQVRFDKAPFSQTVRNLLSHPKSRIRGLAITALLACGHAPEDETTLLGMIPKAEKEELEPLAAAVVTFSKQDLTGEYGPPMLTILERSMDIKKAEGSKTRAAPFPFGSLWGAYLSKEIELRIVEWSCLDDTDVGPMMRLGLGYDIFYHALSTQRNKGHAAVQRLIELIPHPDVTNISGRVIWGIQNTVPDKQDQSLLADAILKLFASRNEDYAWDGGLRTLMSFAGKAQLPALNALIAHEALNLERKKALQALIAKIEAAK
jgi:hypothetical protein